MIYSYKTRMAGPYHIDHNIPCQDACSIDGSNKKYIIAACADGVGSEMYSYIGSDIASVEAVSYCSSHIEDGMDASSIKGVIRNSYAHAYAEVVARAKEDGNSEDEYDTTLCLAIYDGDTLYYGQSGDSGIVILQNNGKYKKITDQQRNEYGDVFPLCWGEEKWVFGEISEGVAAVALMTDGVFEQVCPPIMRNNEININVPLAKKFMDHFDCTEEEVKEVEYSIDKYLELYPADHLDDDKTLVVLINSEKRPVMLNDDYYQVPDWRKLYEDAINRLYNSED